jgi:hypothetical protein
MQLRKRRKPQLMFGIGVLLALSIRVRRVEVVGLPPGINSVVLSTGTMAPSAHRSCRFPSPNSRFRLVKSANAGILRWRSTHPVLLLSAL